MKKNVLITGCSSGIGKSLALQFFARGYKVWATARNIDSIADLTDQGLETDTLDVTCEKAIQRVVERILAEDGHIDILINNAGYGSMGPLLETSGEEMQRQFATNVFAAMSMTRLVAPSMCDRKQGMIVNIGSISGVLSTPFSGNYCASKAALNALSDVLRMELKPFGIYVISVVSGAVRSRFADNANQVVNRIMNNNSRYHAVEEGVRKRVRASQRNPTPADDFSRKLISSLESDKPATILRIAKGSIAYPIIKTCVPTGILERILTKIFMLDKLKIK